MSQMATKVGSSANGERFSLHLGDCMDVLKAIADESVDSIVCDPPYHLTQASRGGHARTNNPEMPHGRHRIGDKGFMGKVWDGGDIAHRVEMWAECLRVLKPGGHLFAFSSTRTYHRMTCAIEDAGFEVRDQFAWVYGQGFPKSKNLSGDWQGWGTAAKPAWEPIALARKPFRGTVEANVLLHGTGALNIDACRVNPGDPVPGGGNGVAHRGGIMGDTVEGGRARVAPHCAGRWPANVIHDGSPEVLDAFPDAPGQMADVSYQDGARKTQNVYGAMNRGHEPSRDRTYTENGGTNFAMKPGARRLDTGSAARFFMTCKQDEECFPQSNAPIAASSLSLQNALADIVQRLVATWVSLEGIVSSDLTGLSTIVTVSESRAIEESVITAIAPIVSGSSHESRHEKHSPCGSHVKVAAIRNQTGITTITASLFKSDGSVGHATYSITPTNLARGEAASRFKYCAKASRQDRNEGIGGSDTPAVGAEATMRDRETADWQERNGNHHPTVKPTDLMAYLCRLVTPPNGLVLDPFMGSGSTGKAAMREGFRFVGIDMTPEYVEIAKARIQFEADRVEVERARAEQERIDASRQGDMFAEVA